MVFQIEAYSESHKRFQPNGKAMAMILFFIDINVFFIYLFSFFFSKRQRSLRSSLRFHRIRSAVICNIVTVTGFHPFGLIFTRFFFFFFKTVYILFFRSRKEQVGQVEMVSVKIISIIGISNSITARRGWIFASERCSNQWPKRFNRSFGKRWKPVDRISRYTSLSIRVSVIVDQIVKCAFHK